MGKMAFTASVLIMSGLILTGCGAELSSAKADSQSKPKMSQSANVPSVKSMLTCIPPNTYYLKIKFLVKHNGLYKLLIGHPLSVQGRIQPKSINFMSKNSTLTEYVPMGVVFETVVNGDLFSFVPKPSITNKSAMSAWFLLYSSSPSFAYTLTKSTWNSNDLVKWPVDSTIAATAARKYEQKAIAGGWKLLKSVQMKKSLTGYLGVNKFIQIPFHVPINLVSSANMGNVIFEIDGIVSSRVVNRVLGSQLKAVECTN